MLRAKALRLSPFLSTAIASKVSSGPLRMDRSPFTAITVTVDLVGEGMDAILGVAEAVGNLFWASAVDANIVGDSTDEDWISVEGSAADDVGLRETSQAWQAKVNKTIRIAKLILGVINDILSS
jgi:hypothetical protein